MGESGGIGFIVGHRGRIAGYDGASRASRAITGHRGASRSIQEHMVHDITDHYEVSQHVALHGCAGHCKAFRCQVLHRNENF